MIKANATWAALLLFAIFFLCEPALAQSSASARAATVVKAERFLRTELYFGRLKRDGTIVSDDDWNRFLTDVVTPQFPDGFTILKATGQYRERSGKIVTEPSEVLVFLYTRNTRISSRGRIEEIRRAYMKQFSQESVLRVDLSKTVQVSF